MRNTIWLTLLAGAALGVISANAHAEFQIFRPDIANIDGDYVTVEHPNALPPFVHWDLREMTNCGIPWSIAYPVPDLDFQTGPNDANDQAAARNAVQNAFGAWESVEPAVVEFVLGNFGAAVAPNTGIALDGHNLVSFVQETQNDQACAAAGAVVGVNGLAIGPGRDGILTTSPDGDDIIAQCIIDGANGVANSVAAGGTDDVQVVPLLGAVPAGCNVVVAPGPNGQIQSVAAGDDSIHFCILAGANGVVDTWPNNNRFAVGGGTLGMTGLFLNNASGTILESDIVLDPTQVWSDGAQGALPVQVITPGPDGVASTTADALDTQSIPRGTIGLAPYAVVVGPGANNVIDTVPAGDDVVTPTADLGTVVLHEIGHFLGIAHSSIGGISNPAGPIMNPGYDPTAANNHALAGEDKDALNFLYSPDLGDAPDPKGVVFNAYPSKVLGSVPSRMLSGVQLFNPAKGAEHLFGFFDIGAVPRFQYEWLGAATGKIDDHRNECQPRLVDLDKFDDGVTFAGAFVPGGPAVNVTVEVRTALDAYGRGHAYGAGNAMYINGWFDWNADGDWDDPGEFPIGTAAGAVPVLASGANAFPIAAPLGAVAGGYARFRLDYREDVGQVSAIDPSLALSRGVAQFGEVEDYSIPFATGGTSTGGTAGSGGLGGAGGSGGTGGRTPLVPAAPRGWHAPFGLILLALGIWAVHRERRRLT